MKFRLNLSDEILDSDSSQHFKRHDISYSERSVMATLRWPCWKLRYGSSFEQDNEGRLPSPTIHGRYECKCSLGEGLQRITDEYSR